MEDFRMNQAGPVCLYCQSYSKIHSDYPINLATFRTDTEVPRCAFHGQYKCDNCGKSHHFNGISWCVECKKFSCLYCGEPEVVRKKFLVYDYYYKITCTHCDKKNPALDFAEVDSCHPYQIGDLRPEGMLQLWLPLGQKIEYHPERKTWGNKRLWDMTVENVFEPVEERAGHSKEIWDANAEVWKNAVREGQGDPNHRKIIIPKMLEFMDITATKVMDIACGEGTFTREVAKAGYQVTGTDVSNLVDYALETEEELQQGIEYHKIGVHQLQDYFERNSFDQITCNMAIMDIDNFPLVLDNVHYLLKSRGQFIFSITHPVTSWPVVKTVRQPRDSHHNEDKGWVINNYNKEQPTLIHMEDMPTSMLYYPRKISTYINNLADHDFIVTQMSEPVPDEKIIMKYPRLMFQNYERNPYFMIFQTRLQS